MESRGVARPYLDLLQLDPWDRWRVLWARIGGWTFVNGDASMAA